MANIDKYLNDIETAVYGEEVRSAIHDSIQEMNEEIEVWTGLQDGSVTTRKIANGAVTKAKLGTDVNTILDDMKTGFDGVTYSSPAEQVIGSDEKLLALSKMTGEAEATGSGTIPTGTMATGFFNSSGNWTTNGSYWGMRNPIVIPNGYKITVSAENEYLNIYELVPNGSGYTRTRVAGNNNTKSETMISTGKLYAFSLYKNGGWGGVTPTDYVAKITCPKDDAFYDEIARLDISAAFVSGTGIANVELAPLSNGYYTDNGTWTSNSTQHAPQKFYKFADGFNLVTSNDFNLQQNIIREYSYSGGSYTLVRKVTNEPLRNTNKNYFYAFSFYNSSGVQTDSYGYHLAITSELMENLKINEASGQDAYSYTASTKTLVITGSKARYTIFRQINGTRNLDSWRLFKGEAKVNDSWFEMWEDSDAEGPVKIDSESDFISGYHGDEILTSASIYIDGVALDTDTDATGTCQSVELYQESKCYKADDPTTQAFTRYKKVVIEGNSYSVQQRWVSLISCTINRGALCLFQCKKGSDGELVGWDTDRLLPRQGVSGSQSLSDLTKYGNMYLKGGVKFSLIPEQGNEDPAYFSASLSDFSDQNRLKYYFDMYNGKSIAVGDELISKFKVEVNDWL